MDRNSNWDNNNQVDEWEEVLAMLYCIAALAGFAFYMIAIFRVDFTVWWTRTLAFIFGALVYTYTVIFAFAGIVKVDQTVRKIIRQRFNWRRFGTLISYIGAFWISQAAVNMLFWGIVKGDSSLSVGSIPLFAITVISIVYLIRYLTTE